MGSLGRLKESSLVRRRRQPRAKQPPWASHRGRILGWALLCLVIAAAYANSISAPFVLDDLPNIVNNQALTEGFSWRALFPLLGTGVASRPVVNLTLALNWAISGPSVWSYHLLNLLIHAAVAGLLFMLSEKTLRRVHSSRLAWPSPTTVALIGALLWAVHPLHTQAVTYTIQRCETLMSFFLLLTLYAALRSWESARPRRWQIISVVACLLGVGSKEVMVAAPLIVMTYDALFVSGSAGKALRRSSWLYAGYAVALAVLARLIAAVSVKQPDQSGLPFGPLDYLLTQAGVILHYLRLAVWPAPLVFDYGWEPATVRGAILPLLGVLCLACTTVYALIRRNPLGFLGAWFFFILAPTSSVWPLRDLAFEHRMYLPVAAVIYLLVWGGFRLLDRWAGSRKGTADAGLRRRQDFLVLLSILILAAGAGTHLRNRAYASEIRLWEDTVRKRPDNARAHTSLGVAYERAGRPGDAVGQLLEAVRLQPGTYDAHYNLGIGLGGMGRSEEAVRHFTQAARLRPGDTRATSALGATLCRLGRLEEGIACLREGLQRAPDHPDLLFNLGIALADNGDVPTAREHLERVLRLEPGNEVARRVLSTLPVDSNEPGRFMKGRRKETQVPADARRE